MLENLQLPPEILNMIKQFNTNSRTSNDDYIGKPGYAAPNDEILYDSLITLALYKNLLLQGPTGSGKTRLAETLINCSVDLDLEALLGFKTLVHREGKAHIEFVPGPVIKAMESGHILYIDEINMAKPETLPILNGILDYRRSITNPLTGQVIRASEGFRVIASINQGYVGTVPLNEALKNRFVIMNVPYLQGERLGRLIKEQSKLQDEKLIQLFVQLSADLIYQSENGQLSEEAASIRALLDAADLAIYLPPNRAIQRAIIDKLDDQREQAFIQNIVDTLL